MGINYNIKAIVTDGLALYLDAANASSYKPFNQAAAVNGQVLYTSEGAHTFTVPDGVSDISAVCIGGGGGGGGSGNTEDGGGGGGGGLSYGTITVTPKESLDVTVGEGGESGGITGDGETGGDSKIERSGTVLLQGEGGDGGEFGFSTSGEGGEGGASTGTDRIGGGAGGDGGTGYSAGGGGGGAGGYEGNGGNGRGVSGGAAYDGSGGGGGGGGSSTHVSIPRRGGGVGILGEHDPVENGEGGAANAYGGTGSGGSNLLYGAGGGGCYRGHANSPGAGGIGAVRIVYKLPTIGTRIYPALANVADTTYNPTNQSWNDLVGSNDGTLTGAYWSDNAFIFDGTNDVISIPNNSDFHFGSGDFTVEVWAYFTTLSGTTTVYATRDSSSDYSPLVISADGTDLQVYSTSADSSWDILNGISFGTISTDTWYQIVLTRSGNTFTRYLNTTSIGTNTSSSTLWANSSALKIGESANSMAGKIPVVRVYKGKALSATEIIQNYDITKRRFNL